MVDLSRWPSRRLGGARSGLGGTPLCSLAQLASAAPSGESPADKQGLQPRMHAPQRWRQLRQRRKQRAARHQSHTQGRQSRQQAGGSAADSAEPEMKVRLSGPWWPGSLGSGLRVRRLGGGWDGSSKVSRHSSVGCSQGPKRGGPDDGRGCPGRGMAHCKICCMRGGPFDPIVTRGKTLGLSFLHFNKGRD
uniref:Uncharacterized protein n=1 Tax=Canis lupus dingo TaxID=286419 RepID=A0A8C0L690_CANLU